ncbi:MAG: universal stress protein [Gammaproteobacteria bacterium]|nr:universal stress protein [Gammaproteobacteria bacterium]MBU1602139.1 universal stress protein [Gammaproteobacteria bacterium]MBU2434186.1 universal stress protein [Gammaproteobacteria bacterium]MBU2448490.1 universal stress protein [Gammaproteobacteria bacterium]
MYKKILVAIDDSTTSQGALAEALHIARTSKAKLYITHVADETVLNLHGHAMTSAVNLDGAVANLVQAGRALLDKAMESATDIDAEALLLEASNRRISEVISEKAKELGVDLIVIGRHGQRGLATLILGSVAEQLAKIADASVLLVRKH